MPILKQRLSKKTKIQIAIAAAVIFIALVLISADVLFHGPLTTLLSNKDALVASIKSLGPLAPLVYILLQILQTVCAPIPGQVVGLIGGFLFGWWGVLWTVLGSSLGFLIVFLISRRFGRPLVEKIIKKEHLDKFDYLASEKGTFAFFLIFLIPGLPDDIVCYVAGLTEIPIKKLMTLIILGRLPAVIMTNFIGAGLGESDLTPVVIATVISVIILAIIIIKRDKILTLLNKNHQK